MVNTGARPRVRRSTHTGIQGGNPGAARRSRKQAESRRLKKGRRSFIVTSSAAGKALKAVAQKLAHIHGTHQAIDALLDGYTAATIHCRPCVVLFALGRTQRPKSIYRSPITQGSCHGSGSSATPGSDSVRHTRFQVLNSRFSTPHV